MHAKFCKQEELLHLLEDDNHHHGNTDDIELEGIEVTK